MAPRTLTIRTRAIHVPPNGSANGTSHTIPITIPDHVLQDGPTRALITQWRNLHRRYVECSKRVGWIGNPSLASKIEKKRRKEKWTIVARILEIERACILYCAAETHHPEIWQPKHAEPHEESHLRRHERWYYQHRYQTMGRMTPSDRAKFRAHRIARVATMRQLVRNWMSLLYMGVFPGKIPPKAIVLHPSELRPRRLKRAYRTLYDDENARRTQQQHYHENLAKYREAVRQYRTELKARNRSNRTSLAHRITE